MDKNMSLGKNKLIHHNMALIVSHPQHIIPISRKRGRSKFLFNFNRNSSPLQLRHENPDGFIIHLKIPPFPPNGFENIGHKNKRSIGQAKKKLNR